MTISVLPVQRFLTSAAQATRASPTMPGPSIRGMSSLLRQKGLAQDHSARKMPQWNITTYCL